MNINLKEGKLLLNWFDIAVECDTLNDADLRLYDKIREIVEDDEDENDPLVYTPSKKSKDTDDSDDFDYEEEESLFDMDEYSDEDKY